MKNSGNNNERILFSLLGTSNVTEGTEEQLATKAMEKGMKECIIWNGNLNYFKLIFIANKAKLISI